MTPTPWQDVVYTGMLFVSGIVLAGLSINLLWKRKLPEATSLGFLLLSVSTWSAIFALEFLAADFRTKLFWAELKYLGIMPLPTVGLIFTLYYIRRQDWLKRRYVLLLVAATAMPLLIVLTNFSHGLFWSYDIADQGGAFSALDFTPAVGFWIFSMYARVVVLICIILFIVAFIRSRGMYRKRTGFVIISILFPFIANGAYDVARHILEVSNFPRWDITPFGVMATCFILSWATLRFRLGDIIPIAHAAITESMKDFIIVLDEENRVIKLNPSAESLLNQSGSNAIGKPAKEVFSHLVGDIDFSRPENMADQEITLGEGDSIRAYDVKISFLKDRHGNFAAKAIVLRDITERGQMQEQLQRHREQLEDLVAQRTEKLVGAITQLQKEVEERNRVEEALKESEKHYKLLADNVTDVIWTMDIETLRFTYVSPSIFAQRGYTVEEAMAQTIDERLTPASVKIAMREMAGELAPENVEREGWTWSRTMELEQICKGGSTIWTEVTVTFVRDKNGQPVEPLGVSRDITDRKKARETLEQSMSALHATLESAADGILVVDTESNIKNYNQRFLEMFDIHEGINKSDLNMEFRKRMLSHLKYPEKVLKDTQELYDRPDKPSFSIMELRDGRILERYWNPQTIAGETVGIVISLRDVTE